MRPTFDAALIADLRHRVIEHNERHPTARAKLGDLRKVYERNFRRSNPGARAMNHVEQHLDRLAKSETFEEDKHPRAKNGEFGSGRGVELKTPATHEEHRKHQLSNAGYTALTTDVIPEKRFEAAGATARDVGSLAAGAAVLHGLKRSTHGGRGERAVGGMLGLGGRMIGGAVGSMVGHPAAAAAKMVGLKRPSMQDADRLQAGAAKLGGKAAHFIGARTYRGVAGVTRKVLQAPKTRGGRAALFAAAAGGLGLGIRSQLKDTFFDPAVHGQTIDAFSYRSIRKGVADSNELGEARRRYTEILAKDGPAGGSMQDLSAWVTAGGGSRESLAKAVLPQPWGRFAVRAFTGAAATGGAIAGGALGFGASRATQHIQHGSHFDEEAHPRAKDGKFTSKAGRDHRFAQVGGLLGGAAAGIAVLQGLRRHNARAQSLAVQTLQENAANLLDRVRSYQFGKAKKAQESGPKRILDAVAADKDHQKALTQAEKLKELGASNPFFVKERLKRAYDEKLGELLGEHPDFQVPKGADWEKITVTGQPVTVAKLSAQRDKATAAIARMDLKTFKTAISKLPDELRSDALRVFQEGEAAVRGVEGKMASHVEALKGAQATLKAAREAEAEAKTAVEAAKSKVTLAPDAEKEAPTTILAAAEKKHVATTAALKRAEKAEEKLRANPSGVMHPFKDQPVPPASQHDVDSAVKTLREAATKKATDKAQKLIEGENEAIMLEEHKRYVGRHNVRMATQAVRGAKYGSPRSAEKATKALAALKGEFDKARQGLKIARLNHAPNELEHAELELATKTTKTTKTTVGGKLIDPPIKVMSAERREDLRGRAPEIRKKHADTAAAVTAAETVLAGAQAKKDAATAVFRRAMEDQPKVKRNMGGFLSEEAKRDLNRAATGVEDAWKEFLKRPSTKKLLDLTEAARTQAKETYTKTKAGAKAGAKQFYRDQFTRDDGKLSLPKVVGGVGSVSALAAAAGVDMSTVKDRLFGSDEEKAAAKKRGYRTNLKSMVDPITGAGYSVLSVPHPDGKNERQVIWGERFDSVHGKATPIHTGGTVSDLQRRMKEREQAMKAKASGLNGFVQAGANSLKAAVGLSTEHATEVNSAVERLRSAGNLKAIGTTLSGPSVELRGDAQMNDDLKQAVDKAGGHITAHLAKHHGTANASPTGADLHTTLATLFSQEGRVFSTGQAFRELTGFNPDGQRGKRKSILPQNDAYALQGADDQNVASALAASVQHIMTHNKPPTPEGVANLMRAVALVGHVKKLSADKMQRLYASIGSAGVAQAAATPTPAPAASQTAPASTAMTVPAAPSAPLIDLDNPPPMTTAEAHAWNTRTAFSHAKHSAFALHERMGIDEDGIDPLASALAGLARSAHRNYHGLSEQSAVSVVTRAFGELTESPGDADALRTMVMSGGGSSRLLQDHAFRRALMEAASKQGAIPRDTVAKAILLDDLDALMKISMGAFVEDLHPRVPSGSPDAGEFTASASHAAGDHGGVGGRVAGEVAEAGGKKASGPSSQGGQVQAWHHPVRLGNEIGGNLGYEAAFNLASRFLPGGTGTIARFGIETVVGMAGSAVGAEGGNALGQAVERSQTGRKRASEYAPPEPTDLGEGFAGMGGAMAGGMWGNAAGATVGALAGRALGGTVGAAIGGPAGAIALGTIAGYAGEKLAGGLYEAGRDVGERVSSFFHGYDQPAVNRAMTRFGGQARTARA